jgi:hypothetical protein
MKMPRRLEALLDAVCAACVSEVKGRMSGFSIRWAKPRDNHWGTWLLEIAPSVLEIAGGSDDGATGFDFLDVDLLALPNCLDDVASFRYDPDEGQNPHLLLEGTKGQREVVVEIYFEPFADEAPQTIFDVNVGGFRQKRLDQT